MVHKRLKVKRVRERQPAHDLDYTASCDARVYGRRPTYIYPAGDHSWTPGLVCAISRAHNTAQEPCPEPGVTRVRAESRTSPPVSCMLSHDIFDRCLHSHHSKSLAARFWCVSSHFRPCPVLMLTSCSRHLHIFQPLWINIPNRFFACRHPRPARSSLIAMERVFRPSHLGRRVLPLDGT